MQVTRHTVKQHISNIYQAFLQSEGIYLLNFGLLAFVSYIFYCFLRERKRHDIRNI